VRLKCDGTRAETIFRLSAKRRGPFKWAAVSVQSTTGSLGVRISGINARYTMFRGSVKSTGYPLHLSVSRSLPLPCVTVCHHISTGLYVQGLSITSAPVRQFYRIKSLHLSGYSVTTAVLRIAIKETRCIKKVINYYYISFFILEWRKSNAMSA
jgi:hypothetical protein